MGSTNGGANTAGNNGKKNGLRPAWQKGQSGNPNGRPKLPAEFRDKGPEALRNLIAFMQHENPNVALRATELVIDRIYGKATQRHEVDLEEMIAILREERGLSEQDAGIIARRAREFWTKTG